MSVMFLGGLTARAMQLQALLLEKGLTLFETYPAAQAKRLNLYESGYKKELSNLIAVHKALQEAFAAYLPPACPLTPATSWHEMDALLALLGALRFVNSSCQTYGAADEGLIWV